MAVKKDALKMVQFLRVQKNAPNAEDMKKAQFLEISKSAQKF